MNAKARYAAGFRRGQIQAVTIGDVCPRYFARPFNFSTVDVSDPLALEHARGWLDGLMSVGVES